MNQINIILKNRLITPLINVIFVLPNPFNTLDNVVFKYKKGQIHASVVMKTPARELEYTKFPKNSPNIKKKMRQVKPKMIQNEKDL